MFYFHFHSYVSLSLFTHMFHFHIPLIFFTFTFHSYVPFSLSLICFTFNGLNQVNPDPYVECDPEVDIDKAQAEEDANYFDEEDLGNCHMLV